MNTGSSSKAPAGYYQSQSPTIFSKKQWIILGIGYVFDDEKLIGIGRLISDGALYACVCDMIVFHAYQKRGIGSAILKMLKDKCKENGIQRVWLFAAAGRAGFYVKNGFNIRPEDAPGMQMKKSDNQ